MSVREFHKAVTYLREVQEVTLFATMADSRWYMAFGASPLFYIMLPFIGILLTINALVNAYYLVKAHNKNFDQWFNLIVSATCTALASVSLYGAVLSVYMGVSFVAGPWIFFSSLMLATTHQVIMLGLNFYRAYESLPESAQRMHYVQAGLNNLFILGLLSAAVGSVIFLMLFPPVAPLVGMGCAITVCVATVLDIIWRTLPHNFKLTIKGFLNLGKPDLIPDEKVGHFAQTKPIVDQDPTEQDVQHPRLFTCFDYSAAVRKMDYNDAKKYLCQKINNKIESYPESAVREPKIKDKISLLNIFLASINNGVKISKKDLLERYPLAFQSFWVEKGDVEQLFDAVAVFQKKNEPIPIIDPLNVCSIQV